MAAGRLLPLLVASLLAAACTRSRPQPDLGLAAPAESADGRIEVTQPDAAAAVPSPVQIAGRLAPAGDEGDQLAALIRSRQPGGELRWRGNGPLQLEADGSFSGVVTYTLESDVSMPGVVEVLLFDPANGTTRERAQVEVTLTGAGP
jgi:hypothetical protein